MECRQAWPKLVLNLIDQIHVHVLTFQPNFWHRTAAQIPALFQHFYRKQNLCITACMEVYAGSAFWSQSLIPLVYCGEMPAQSSARVKCGQACQLPGLQMARVPTSCLSIPEPVTHLTDHTHATTHNSIYMCSQNWKLGRLTTESHH